MNWLQSQTLINPKPINPNNHKTLKRLPIGCRVTELMAREYQKTHNLGPGDRVPFFLGIDGVQSLERAIGRPRMNEFIQELGEWMSTGTYRV